MAIEGRLGDHASRFLASPLALRTDRLSFNEATPAAGPTLAQHAPRQQRGSSSGASLWQES